MPFVQKITFVCGVYDVMYYVIWSDMQQSVSFIGQYNKMETWLHMVCIVRLFFFYNKPINYNKIKLLQKDNITIQKDRGKVLWNYP